MTGTTELSRYDRRLKLVRDTVKAHSELDDQAASKIAVHVLYAIDRVPEKVR